MPRSVFEMVFTRLKGQGILVTRVEGLGRPGIHPLQHLVASLQMLGYGYASDAVDNMHAGRPLRRRSPSDHSAWMLIEYAALSTSAHP